MELKLDKEKGWLLNGNPISAIDVLMLTTHVAGRDKDKDLESVLDYWVMLKECGHNGFHLKSGHQVTTNIHECVKCVPLGGKCNS